MTKEDRIVKAKKDLKDTLELPNGKFRSISAQGFKHLDNDEREALREVIEEAALSYEDWEQQAKRLWPKEVVMKPIVWRKR